MPNIRMLFSPSFKAIIIMLIVSVFLISGSLVYPHWYKRSGQNINIIQFIDIV